MTKKVKKMSVFSLISDLLKISMMEGTNGYPRFYSKILSLITFFVTMFMEVYHLVTGKTSSFFLEIIVTNFVFILSVLGIRGFIYSKMLSINHENNNNNNNNHKIPRHYDNERNQGEGDAEQGGSYSKEDTSNNKQEWATKRQIKYY